MPASIDKREYLNLKQINLEQAVFALKKETVELEKTIINYENTLAKLDIENKDLKKKLIELIDG